MQGYALGIMKLIIKRVQGLIFNLDIQAREDVVVVRKKLKGKNYIVCKYVMCSTNMVYFTFWQ